MGLRQRIPVLRWSFLRLAVGSRNITRTGQIGDGREAAAADYVLAHACRGDIDHVLATIDEFAYQHSFLINVGDEKGALLDTAVRRADPRLALELGTYVGYGALRIARAAPDAKVYSVELAEANAAIARRIWDHAGVGDRVTCVVGTIGDGGPTLDALADADGFSTGRARLRVHRPRQDGLSHRPAEHRGPRLAARRLDRRRRQRQTARRAEVPRLHAGTAGHGRGTPSSTRRTPSIRRCSRTWCWNPST